MHHVEGILQNAYSRLGDVELEVQGKKIFVTE